MCPRTTKKVKLSSCIILQLNIIRFYVVCFLFAMRIQLFYQHVSACQGWENSLYLGRCQRATQHINFHFIEHCIVAKHTCRVAFTISEHRPIEQCGIERQHVRLQIVFTDFVKIVDELSVSVHHVIKYFSLLITFKQTQCTHEANNEYRLVISFDEWTVTFIHEIDFFLRVVVKIFQNHLSAIFVQHVKTSIISVLVGFYIGVQ